MYVFLVFDAQTLHAAFDKLGKEIEKWMKQDNMREFPQPYVGTVIAVHAFLTAEAADKHALESVLTP